MQKINYDTLGSQKAVDGGVRPESETGPGNNLSCMDFNFGPYHLHLKQRTVDMTNT